MQFLSENRLNGCQIFGRFGFQKPNPNRTSVFHTSLQPGNRVLTFLGNSGLCWTVFAWNRDTVVPDKGNDDLQTLTYVLADRPGRCPTLSNPVLWQRCIAAYLATLCRWKCCFLAGQLWFTTGTREEEEDYWQSSKCVHYWPSDLDRDKPRALI